MTVHNRPLSPHLGIYRKQITSVLSITHRFTGLALVFGTLPLVAWLWSAAYAPEFFNRLHEWLMMPVGQAMLFGWLLAFYYHLSNGVRHLFWDAGKGFTIPQVNRSGWLVIIFTLVMTLFTWGFVQAGQ